MSVSTFCLSIETAPGQSHQYGYHLGTIEAIARQCVVDRFAAHVRHGLPVVTMALMRDGRIVDVFHGSKWDSDYAAELDALDAGHTVASYAPSASVDAVPY